LKLALTGIPSPMSDGTSDEDDHADYTDDHQGDHKRVGPADVEGRDGEDLAPDVADAPDFEPPD
jgi:hypothetical protein